MSFEEMKAWPRSFDPFCITRRPTYAEAFAVGRDFGESEGEWKECDLVVVLTSTPTETLREVAQVFAAAGACDDAHVLPGVGIYLEE
jgi:hypothetical protein